VADQRDTGADVERFPPTHEHADTREETIARAVADDPVHQGRERIAGDPSARRHFGRVMIVRPHVWALGGAVLGALIGLLLALNATPVEAPGMTDRGPIGTLFGTLGYMLLLALAFSLVFLAISGLIYSAREDGRTERLVEEEQDREPTRPARPLDPKHDV